MICDFCKSKIANHVQTVISYGIEEKVCYCDDCLKKIIKNEISNMNKMRMNFLVKSRILCDQKPNTSYKSKENLSPIPERLIIEQPIKIQSLIFDRFENQGNKNKGIVLKRSISYWKKRLEEEKENFNWENVEMIEKIIKHLKLEKEKFDSYYGDKI